MVRPGRTGGVAQSALRRSPKKQSTLRASTRLQAAGGYYLLRRDSSGRFSSCESTLVFVVWRARDSEDMRRCTALLLLLVVSLYFLSAEGKVFLLFFFSSLSQDFVILGRQSYLFFSVLPVNVCMMIMIFDDV